MSSAIGRALATDTGLRFVLKPLVFLACLLPLAWLVFTGASEGLGANPVETVTRFTGLWTLRLLLITLCVTPLRRLSGWRWPLRLRRMLGLFVFFYASLHFLTFLWFEHGFALGEMAADILERPFVTIGFSAWLVLLALALTSNDYMVRRLKRRWAALHRGVYLATLAAVLHFAWLVKAGDYARPVLYLTLAFVLFAFRLVVLMRGRA